MGAIFTDTATLKATVSVRGKVIAEDTFDLAMDAWMWLRGIRDEQEDKAGLEYGTTARRLHQIVMTVQAFGELDGTGAVFGAVPGEDDAEDPDHVDCRYVVEFAK